MYYHCIQCVLTSSEGALSLGAPGGGHIWYTDATMETGQQLCCQDTAMCPLYYDRRPSDNCSRYEAPGLGKLIFEVR